MHHPREERHGLGALPAVASAALIANPGTLELWRLDMGNEDPHLARCWTADEIAAMSPARATYRGWPRTGIKIEMAQHASFVFVPIDGVLSRRRFAVDSIERLKAGMAGNQR